MLLFATHCSQFRSGKRISRFNAYLTGNSTYHGIVISRQDFYFNAMLVQLPDGTCRRLLRRIEKRQIPDKHHFVLILHTEITFLVQITLLCHGNDPHSLLVHLLTDFFCLLFQFGHKGLHLPFKFGIRTNFEHFFYRSLGDNLPFSLFIFHHNRHTPASKIERDFVNFLVIILQVFQIKILHMRKDGLIHQILQTSLKETVKERVAQNTLIVVA